MSVFTQSSNALQALLAEWSGGLSTEVDEQNEILSDWQGQHARAPIDLETLTTLHEGSAAVDTRLRAFDARLQQTATQIGKFHAKAEEGKRNPDQQIYGASMLGKISAAHADCTKLVESYTQPATTFRALHASLTDALSAARTQAEVAARAAAEAAERARVAEEAARQEREKREAEERAREEAARKAREEAERKEREAAAAEAARAAKQAAEARAAEERRERERVLAERRAAAEQEAKRAAEAQASEASASKPLLERSLDALKAALREIKAGSTPEEYQVALQTLLKFLGNIMASPREEKFRHIRAENEIFQRRLGSRPGGTAALKAIGFELWQSPATQAAGSDLQPSTQYWKIDAKAELWPVLVAAKKEIEDAMKAAGASVPGGAGPAAAAPGAANPQAAAASPFAALFGAGGGFPGFPGFPGAPAGGAAAGAGGASPFGAAAGGAGAGAAGALGGMNPMALMSDPFVQQLMSSPTLMSQIGQMGAGGAGPDRMAIMNEVMSNPQLLTSMMQSPVVQQVMANPQLVQQMAAARGVQLPNLYNGQQSAAPPAFGAAGAANPFAAMFGGGAPPAAGATPPAGGAAANPMAAWLNMMRPPAGASAGTQPPAGQAPFSPFNFMQPQQPAASPAATPAAAPNAAQAPAPNAAAAPAAGGAAPMEDVEDEEALAAAIAMSMQGGGNESQGADKQNQ